jgi:nucleoside-diphosphate-sugar epimerase
MKALIIGGTGNISRYVSALALERGWELWLLNRGKRPESVPEGAHLLRGDVHDEAAAKKLLGDMTFDSVSEFTAFTPKDAERDLRLFSGRTKQYIFISSATVYRKPPASYPVREGDSLGNPYWKYARDKIACEEILMREFRDSGFPVTIVRPSHTYGDGSITLCVHGSGGPWQIVKNIIDRKPVIVAGDGTTLWTVTHSEDFARGFVGLMGNTAAVGECLHLTSGEALTWNDIYDRVGAALGVEVETKGIHGRSSRSRAGSSTTRWRSGEPRAASRARRWKKRACARKKSPPSASPTSAKRRSSGTKPPASRSTTPSSGSAGARRICDELKARGLEDYIRENTGLVIDAYFSGTKVKWILDHVERRPRTRREGRAAVRHRRHLADLEPDGGAVHVTDYTNASRTMLFNIQHLQWDEASSTNWTSRAHAAGSQAVERVSTATPTPHTFGGAMIPIAGIRGRPAGGAVRPGLLCRRHGQEHLRHRLLPADEHRRETRPVAQRPADDDRLGHRRQGRSTRSKAAVFVAGAAVQWLRDELKLIDTAAQSEAELAMAVPDSNGVYVVPAFVGLGAPYWDMYARGTIVGLTRGANRNHIVRATLESIAYQTATCCRPWRTIPASPLKALKVDGGAVANNFLMQFQSDILGVPVERPKVTETTAIGAAFLAGLAVGFWKDSPTGRRRYPKTDPTLSSPAAWTPSGTIPKACRRSATA